MSSTPTLALYSLFLFSFLTWQVIYLGFVHSPTTKMLGVGEWNSLFAHCSTCSLGLAPAGVPDLMMEGLILFHRVFFFFFWY
jgi:hypothetical protein